MLRTIKENIPVVHQKAVMPVIRQAMDASAGRGMSGYPDSTSIVEQGDYEVTADVCGGGCAWLTVKKVSTILP
jgi:hypothetical protein